MTAKRGLDIFDNFQDFYAQNRFDLSVENESYLAKLLCLMILLVSA